MRIRTLLLVLGLLCSFSTSIGRAATSRGSARSEAYTLELVDEAGNVLPTFQHHGRTYVWGQEGQRYQLRIRNHSERRVELVASVDGRDVLDGKPASFGKRGYLVEAYGVMTIEGFRVSDSTVAAFRFSNVSDSYAAKTGNARDVGVIGVAVFPERPPRLVTRPRPAPYPSSTDSADEGMRGQRSSKSAGRPTGAPAPSAPSASSSPSEARAEMERPGLGTEFGEAHASQVTRVPFERAGSRPAAVLSLRYNDKAGLEAVGIDVDGSRRLADERWLRDTAEPFRQNAGYSSPPPGWTPSWRR